MNIFKLVESYIEHVIGLGYYVVMQHLLFSYMAICIHSYMVYSLLYICIQRVAIVITRGYIEGRLALFYIHKRNSSIQSVYYLLQYGEYQFD